MDSRFMTIVIQMPESIEQRRQIVDTIGLNKEFHGGRVTAVSLDDEISRVERYAQEYGELDDEKTQDSRPSAQSVIGN